MLMSKSKKLFSDLAKYLSLSYGIDYFYYFKYIVNFSRRFNYEKNLFMRNC